MRNYPGKILLLGDRYSTRQRLFNLGDSAVIDGVHRLLENCQPSSIISGPWKKFPYFTSKALSPDYSTTDINLILDSWTRNVQHSSPRKAGYESVMIRILRNTQLLNNPLINRIDKHFFRELTAGVFEAIFPYIFRNYWSQEMMGLISEADMVVFNGGGLLADHLHRYLPTHLWEMYFTMQLGKPVITINQSVDISRSELRQLVRLVYSNTLVNMVREPLSAQELIDIGIPTYKIALSADSVFAIPPSDIPDMKQAADINHIGPNTVGVTVRGDRAVNLDAWTILINYLIEELGLDVIWIHTTRPHDEYVANHLIKNTGIRVLDRDYDYLEVIGLMRYLGLMLSDRYHACIFALMAGCPLVPFASNTHKVRGLFDLFQYPLPVQNIPKGKELRETFHAIAYAINHRNELSASGLSAYNKFHTKVYDDIRIAIEKCH